MVLCMRKVLAVPRVAGLQAVKCLVTLGTLGKRLTSGKVNFLHASVRFHFHEAKGFGELLQG